MKLEKGVKVRKNNKTYRGECPDEFINKNSKKLIDDYSKRVSKTKTDKEEISKVEEIVETEEVVKSKK